MTEGLSTHALSKSSPAIPQLGSPLKPGSPGVVLEFPGDLNGLISLFALILCAVDSRCLYMMGNSQNFCNGTIQCIKD